MKTPIEATGTSRLLLRLILRGALGLALIDAIEGLDGYLHLHSARADLLRRLGRGREAAEAYDRALALASQPTEQAFLERRLVEVRSSA